MSSSNVLSSSQKEIIKASIPILETSGVDLTYGFYKHMFETHPEVVEYFNLSHHETKKQPKILAHALVQYAKNIDNLTPLISFVQHVAIKHVGLQVKPEQYQIVGECLLFQLKSMLGDAATDEFMEAWELAYHQLADILIDAEKKLYREQSIKADSWEGFKEFVVSKLQDEAIDVKTVVLRPKDGKIVVASPGQYITLKLKPGEHEILTQREYTLSNGLDSYKSPSSASYSISVRKEEGGIVSNYIHDSLNVGDVLKVSVPLGQLSYVESNKPLVLVAGGIGITPMISIIEYALSKNREVVLYYSNKTEPQTAFSGWIKGISKRYPDSFSYHLFLTRGDVKNTNTKDFIYRRVISKDFDDLKGFETCYVIGRSEFSTFVIDCLVEHKIPKENIITEEFGPLTV